MIPKLSEMWAKLTSHESAIAKLTGDKSAATESAVAGLNSDFAALKAGTLAALEKANSDLAAALQNVSGLTASLGTANTAIAATGTALAASCKALKLEIKEGATQAEMITALENGVSTTLAKMNISVAQIPVAKPAAAAGDEKVKTLAQWRAMNPAEAALFFRNGGKLRD